MSHTLDGINLPDDLIWSNEFDWTPIEQNETYSLGGALLVESGVKLAGQPITLTGDATSAWALRSLIKTLKAKLANDAEMTLIINGDVFTVIFDHKNQPINAKPIIDYSSPDNTDNYSLILKFITV